MSETQPEPATEPVEAETLTEEDIVTGLGAAGQAPPLVQLEDQPAPVEEKRGGFGGLLDRLRGK